MKYFIVILIICSASLLGDSTAPRFFVTWNVGQGQWLTAITPTQCFHFDMGGEFFPWKKILRHCAHKENRAYLSHWDWDHIGALKVLGQIRKLRNFCIALAPQGKSSKNKEWLLQKFTKCKDTNPRDIAVWSPSSGKLSNDRSHVVIFKDILIPGDSTSEQEKTWVHFARLRSQRILVLGHHGSRTSTSEHLLRSLPELRMGICSARWGRYRHPHSQVTARLIGAGVSVLRTEDWGNIWFE